MKELPKLIILLLAGFVAGFGAYAGTNIFQRKMRTSAFLAEAEGEVLGLRQKVAAYEARRGRRPKDVAELVRSGFWDPQQPPVERLRGQARWSGVWDGDGGFCYLSSTGQIYLNADLKREKLLRSDIERLKTGDLLPPGTFF